MAADERGRWFRVYAVQVRDHDKFRDLTGLELGAWFALRSEAELRAKAVIADRAEALVILRRRKVPRPGHVLDALIARRLFDVDAAGRITVHDRADHDRTRYPSDAPERVRDRVRRHREGNDRNDSLPLVTEKSNDTHARARVSGAGADSVSLSDEELPQSVDTAREAPGGWDAPDAVVAYNAITGRWPSETIIDWLNRLSNDHPEEAIADALAAQHADDPNPRTLMSRTEGALKLDAHRRTKAAERARAEAMRRATEPHVERERQATPEEREQATFQRRAISIALRRGIAVPTDPSEVRHFVMSNEPA